MKVLFTHSYFLYFDKKQFELSKPFPPLGTIQAASYLRENSFDVSLFDTQFLKDPHQIKSALETQKPDILVIYDDGFNYLNKMCLTNMREAAFEMIKTAKSFVNHILVSSSDSTDHFSLYLDKGADVIIIGEGEETLLETVTAIKNKESFNNIDGIIFRENNENSSTPKRNNITDLDKLPLPAWDLIDIEQYKKAWQKHGYFSINMVTTRGCPYKCTWCAKPIFGYSYNTRSPNHVIAEIKYIKSLVEFDEIWFCDDIFGLKPGWIKEFSNLLKDHNLKINYKIQSRADLILKEEVAENLKASGCREVWIGAESGSQKILDAMEKGSTVAQIEESTILLKKHGIKTAFFLQFGYLSETWEDIKMTLNMLFRMMPYDLGVSVSYPLPGTKFHSIVESQLKQKSNWSDSDELLLMYKSTYSPKFYKKLHRFIHKRFRQKQIENKTYLNQSKAFIMWPYFKLMSSLIYCQLLILKKTENHVGREKIIDADH
jgi:anaerobic magnesium-protoporphyrin IX monomethyl ester cyclase